MPRPSAFFVAPLPLAPAAGALVSLSSRCARRPYRCCHSSPDDEEKTRSNANLKLSSSTRSASPFPFRDLIGPAVEEEEEVFKELDDIAENWIGNDLTRWEWYEHTKARRSKMVLNMRNQEKKIDADYQELTRTFMELDALLGTSMLDSKGDVSKSGWSLLAFLMLAYVGVGVILLELLVNAGMQFYASIPPF